MLYCSSFISPNLYSLGLTRVSCLKKYLFTWTGVDCLCCSSALVCNACSSALKFTPTTGKNPCLFAVWIDSKACDFVGFWLIIKGEPNPDLAPAKKLYKKLFGSFIAFNFLTSTISNDFTSGLNSLPA